MTDAIDGEPADNLPFESPDPYGVGEDEESGQPGNSGGDARRAGWPRPGDNRPRDSVGRFDRRRARDVVTEECVLRTSGLTVEEILDLLAGCWTHDSITLADLNASEYDSLVVDTITQRDNALRILKQIAELNEEAHQDDWSAIGLYSGIRALLKTGTSA